MSSRGRYSKHRSPRYTGRGGSYNRHSSFADDEEEQASGPSRRPRYDSNQSSPQSNSFDRATGGGPRRGGYPFGLKGKDIGMYYAAKAREKKEQELSFANDAEEQTAGPSCNSGYDSCQIQQSSQSNSFDRGADIPFRRGGRPPGLTGREIGLYYAARSVVKKKEQEFQSRVAINLDADRQVKITSLLQQLNSSYNNNTTQSIGGQFSTTLTSEAESFQRNFSNNLHANALAESATPSTAQISVIKRNEALDLTLSDELRTKIASSARYKNMLHFRRGLPAHKCMEEIIDIIANNQVSVISGETGCGKSTQVAQFVLDRYISEGQGSMCNILCTQPRRISAVSVAERVAAERDEIVGGNSVGYSIRLTTKLPKRPGGTISFCTTGVVFQYLKYNPNLTNVSHIICDEIHERDVLCDFLLAILKDLISRRPDLKIILMSATLNAEHFSSYFNNCPVYNIPGQTFPVQEYYLEDVLEKTQFVFPEPRSFPGKGRGRSYKEAQTFDLFIGGYARKLEREKKYSRNTIKQIRRMESEDINLDLIQALTEFICSTDNANGAILVFVPGWDSISNLHKQLQKSGKFPPAYFLIIPLHSMMPTVNQKEVFDRPPPGSRKIIIATNIAETSITIDDIVFIIDCGKIKITNFDLQRNLETLDTEWVSLANATQRKGRAGRVQAGVCYHLFSKARLSFLESFKKPEILRKRLEEVVLQIKILKLGKTVSFLNRLMDPPSERSIELALQRLVQLNALDEDENLTPLGFHLGHLPMDPQTGKMILMGAIFSCVDPIFSIAASLSFKDSFYIPLGQEKNVDRVRLEMSENTKSDHMVMVKAIEGFERAKERNVQREYCYRNFLSMGTLTLLLNLKEQFAQYLYNMHFLPSLDCKHSSVNINSQNVALIKSVTCSGLYPNVARVAIKNPHKGGGYPVVFTNEDGRVNIHPKSVNANERDFESPFLAYHQKLKSTSIFLHDTTMVSPFPLIFFGGRLDFIFDRGFGSIGVDGTIRFRCEENIFNLVQALRKELDDFLKYKISHPGPTEWSEISREGPLLRAIIELITTEYKQLMNGNQFGSDDSDDD